MNEMPIVPQSDPHLVAFVGESVRSGADPEAFVVLSDEEIVAIDRELDPEVALAPWALDQPDLDVSHFTRFGERSLLLRGLVTLDIDPERVDDPVRSSTEGVLDLAISARRSGCAMIRMTGHVAEYRIGIVASVQPEHGAVLEEVRPEGLHLFTAYDYRRAAARMAEWCVPETATTTGQGEVTVTDAQWPDWAANELGVDAHLAEVDLFLPADGGQVEAEHWVVASGDDTAVLVTRLDPEHLRVQATNRATVADLLRDRMTRAVSVVTT